MNFPETRSENGGQVHEARKQEGAKLAASERSLIEARAASATLHQQLEDSAVHASEKAKRAEELKTKLDAAVSSTLRSLRGTQAGV